MLHSLGFTLVFTVSLQKDLAENHRLSVLFYSVATAVISLIVIASAATVRFHIYS